MSAKFFPEASRVHWPGIGVLTALLLAPNAFAADVIAPLGQQAQPAPVARQPLPAFSPGIADVVKMLDARVDPEVVKAFIKASSVAYNPSAEEIVALKQHGVPDDILTALIQRGAEVRSQSSTQAPAPAPVYVQPPEASSPPPYTSSPVPDYLYDYGYPGYPSASYWDGWPAYSPWYVGISWGYPWYSSWWWYNYWYPCFTFYTPFYYGCYGYHRYPYRGYCYSGPWRHDVVHHYAGGQVYRTGYNSRGTWAGGQRSPGRAGSPYSGYRNGYVRSTPSAASAVPARSLGRTGSPATRQTFSRAQSTRQGLYASPRAYRGSSGVIRGSGGVGASALTRSSGSFGGFRGSSAAAAGAMRSGSFGGGGSRFGGFRSGSLGGRSSFGGRSGFSGGGGFRGGGGGGFGGGHGGGRR